MQHRYKFTQKENIQNLNNTTTVEKQNNKNTKKVKTKDKQKLQQYNQIPLEVIPPQIVFHNIEQKKVYEITFAIRNQSKKQKKVKVSQAKLDCFTIELEEQNKLAPGLTYVARVIYRSNNNNNNISNNNGINNNIKEIFDKFTVYTDDYSIDIPISVFPPSAFFVFKPYLDYGFVEHGQEYIKNIKIKNEGLKAGEINFQHKKINKSNKNININNNNDNNNKDQYIHIVPSNVFIEQGQEVNIKVILNAKEEGIINDIIELEMIGHSIYRAIDISANVIESNQYLLDEKGEKIDKIDFGDILVNEKKQKRVMIINNSPKEIEYNINVIRGYHNTSPLKSQLQTPYDKGREMTEKILAIKPNRGIIQAYGNSELQIIFKQPPTDIDNVKVNKYVIQENVDKIENIECEYTAIIQFEKMEKQKYVQIQAICELPRIYFPIQYMDFGSIQQNEKKMIEFEIINRTQNQQVLIECPREYYIHSDIQSIYIQAMQQIKIKFELKTNYSGVFTKILYFKVNKCFEIPIKVFAYVNTISQKIKNSNNITQEELQQNEQKIEKLRQKHLYLNKIQKLKIPKMQLQQQSKKQQQQQYSENLQQKFIVDPTLRFREFTSKCHNIEHKKYIQQKLNGEQLMKIQVGPIDMNFGTVFVNSTSILYFQIKNDLKQPIKVQLNIDENFKELQNSYKKPQIIPQQKIGAFRITLDTYEIKDICEKISYIINDKHNFNIMIQAEIIPVQLELSKEQLYFRFDDDSIQMYTTEKLYITNTGNSDAYYRFMIQEDNSLNNNPFKINEKRQKIKAKEKIEVEVQYIPQNKIDEVDIVLEIENGKQKIIKCQGQCNETKCQINTKNINMGILAIGQEKVENYSIKNMDTSNHAVFEIDKNSLPQGVEIRPMYGKIIAEGIQEFELRYQQENEIEIIEHQININVRGSKMQKIWLSVKTIQPQIEIQQKQFDFGNVKYQNIGIQEMIIENKSQVNAEILIDMTTKDTQLQEYYECIEINKIEEKTQNSVILEKIKKNSSNSVCNNTNGENDKQDIIQQYIIKLKAKQIGKLQITFCPQKPETYEFELPFYIPTKNKNIFIFCKKIKCIGSNPKFLMESQNGIIQFAKKIILSVDQIVPEYKSLTVSNPDANEPLIWKFDQEIIKKQNIFSINPSQGIIEPLCPIQLHIGFQPYKAQYYEQEIPIYLGQDNTTTAYSKIILRGEGAYPRLLFDVEEVIMDIVPLNQKSVYILTIYNDGYNNSNITAQVQQDSNNNIPINIRFIGNSNIGINNTKIQLEISFVSSIAMSFTTRINFEDEQKRVFDIKVSGTADNSLLTNYQYFINNPRYSIVYKQNKGYQIQYIKDEDNIDEIDNDDDNNVQNMINNSQQQQENNNEYDDNDDDILSQNSQYYSNKKQKFKNKFERQISECIKQWLKEYGICNIQNYPQDIIQNNGNQIIDLISFLVKNNLCKININNNSNNNDTNRIEELLKHYTKILNYMIEHNAMIKTIKIQYLLSYKDYKQYIEKLRKNNNSNIHEKYYKTTQKEYEKISIQNWNLLITQIIKVFYLCRITTKQYKQSFIGIEDIQSGGKNDIEQQIDNNNSSVYSSQEILLLKWLEQIYKHKIGTQKIFVNFDKDMQDSLAIVSCIETYIQLNLQQIKKMKKKVENNEDIQHNYTILKKLMQEYSIKDDIKEEEFINTNPITFLLLTMHLFQILPNYISRNKINFECALHESVTKEISFTNPANKTIIYEVKIIGHENYKKDQDILKLDPKQQIQYAVHYYANTSLPAEAKIIFQNRKNGNSIAGAICFDLYAEVKERYSMKTLTINNMNLYQIGTTEIIVENPFEKDVEFQIEIQNVEYDGDDNEENEKSNRRKNKKYKNKQNNINEKISSSNNNKLQKRKNKQQQEKTKKSKINYPQFFIKQQRIWIQQNQQTKINLTYFPITLETHKCNIIFLDPKVGEMQYEIIGIPKMPEILQSYRYQKNIQDFNILEINIPMQNKLYEDAQQQLLKKLEETKQKKILREIETEIKEKNKKIEEEQYTVEIEPNGYFHYPQKFVIKNIQDNNNMMNNTINNTIKNNNNSNNVTTQKEIKQQQQQQQQKKQQQSQQQIVQKRNNNMSNNNNNNNNILQLTPIHKQPVKDLQFRIIMKNQQKSNIRIYNVNLTVLPKVIQATIEIHSTARMEIIQDIPITNPTDIDCLIKPTCIELENGKNIDVNQNIFTIKKKSMMNYRIRYRSEWIGKSEIKLNLLNQQTNDNFEYIIKGETEEPLSENNIKIKTKAREKTEIILKIKNPIKKSNKFIVDCDIQESKYKKKIQIKYEEEQEYIIEFTPKIGGQFMHALTFTDNEGKYFWYLLTIEIDSPQPDGSIDIYTEIRKPIIQKIILKNETEKDIKYRVIIENKNLQGEEEIIVEKNTEKKEYDLIYYPFKIEKKKSRIGFINEQEGEIWYELNLQSIEANPQRLALMSAELGKYSSEKVKIKNPLKNTRVQVKSEIQENSNFEISEKSFWLEAKEEKEIEIRYRPRQLNKKETDIIILRSKELGNWKYLVYGIGIPPTSFEKIVINSIVEKTNKRMIQFKNPFNQDIQVQVELKYENMDDCNKNNENIDIDTDTIEVFQLQQLKSKNVIIKQDQMLQFLVKFSPKIIKTYKANVYIKLNKKIYWCYPIEGITESQSDIKEITLSSVCGKEIEKTYSQQIYGLEKVDKEEEFEYTIQIKNSSNNNGNDKNIEKIENDNDNINDSDNIQNINIQKWFKIKTIKNKIEENGDYISYILSFLPYKPMKATIDLIIERRSGGRWRVKVHLEAIVPEYFETITIISQLNVKKNVQFKLYNSDKKQSNNFIAYFTQDSDTEFSVQPQKGILQPEIKDGTLIQISYLPVEYGKLKIGKLIIETENYMWRFLVKGAFKKYLPPNKNNKKTMTNKQYRIRG